MKALKFANSSGFNLFHNPSFPLKVAIPLSAEMPAPVKNSNDLASLSFCTLEIKIKFL